MKQNGIIYWLFAENQLYKPQKAATHTQNVAHFHICL